MSSGKRIFGAFTVGIALFFVWPAVVGGWQQVNALRASVAEREQLLAQRQEILANIQTAYQEYQQRLGQEEGRKFAAFVPVRKDTAEVISALQDIATESGVQITDIRVSEASVVKAGQQKTLSFAISLTGSYASARAFLDRMEQYVRLMNVDSIEISADSRNSDSLRFSIRADAYFIQ